MLHSPFLCATSGVSSCLSIPSRSVLTSSGGGKVPERQGKQRDTLYLAFSALPHING